MRYSSVIINKSWFLVFFDLFMNLKQVRLKTILHIHHPHAVRFIDAHLCLFHRSLHWCAADDITFLINIDCSYINHVLNLVFHWIHKGIAFFKVCTFLLCICKFFDRLIQQDLLLFLKLLLFLDLMSRSSSLCSDLHQVGGDPFGYYR